MHLLLQEFLFRVFRIDFARYSYFSLVKKNSIFAAFIVFSTKTTCFSPIKHFYVDLLNIRNRNFSPGAIFCKNTCPMDNVRKSKKGCLSIAVLDIEYHSLIYAFHIWLVKKRFCNYVGADNLLLYLYMESQ